MMNKKGFTSQDFVISGLLFVAMIVFFVIAISSGQTNYPNSPDIIDPTFESKYNTLQEQLDDVTTIRDQVTSEEGLSFLGTFDVVFSSFFTVVSLVFGTLDLFGTMYLNLSTDFPFIDSIVLNNFFIIGLAIITIILAFRVINSIGRNPF